MFYLLFLTEKKRKYKEKVLRPRKEKFKEKKMRKKEKKTEKKMWWWNLKGISDKLGWKEYIIKWIKLEHSMEFYGANNWNGKQKLLFIWRGSVANYKKEEGTRIFWKDIWR